MKDFGELVTDTALIDTPNGSWPFARNILKSKKIKSISNEHGFKFRHLVPGNVIGQIETNVSVVFFSVTSDGFSEIGRVNVDNAAPQYVREIKTKLFNFSIHNPIEGIYIYNYKGELTIAFCDGVNSTSNSPKVVNLDNPSVQLNAAKDLINPEEFDKLNWFPKVKEAKIDLTYLEAGNIEGFAAFATYCYVYDDNSTTAYFSPTTLAYLGSSVDPVDKKGMRLKFTNLDTNFKAIKVALIVKDEGNLVGYESYEINYSGSTLTFDITSLSNYLDISVENIILSKMIFDKLESITKANNQVVVGNYTVPSKLDIQKYVNRLSIKPYKYLGEQSQDPSLMPGEVYALYLEVQHLDGTWSDAHHIPNREAESGERDLVDTTFNNKYGTSWASGYRKFHIENRGEVSANGQIAKMGYWENEETYPNIDDFDSRTDYNGSFLGGKDLRNKPIRYHRMPSMRNMASIDSNVYTADSNNLDNEKFYKLGIKVENFNTAFPIWIRNKIQAYRISFVKRSFGNSYVVGNWITTRRGSQNWTQAGVPLTYEYHDFNLNPKSDERHYGALDIDFSKMRVLSNELYKFKPSVDLTYLETNYLFNVKETNERLYPSDAARFGEIKQNLKYRAGNNIADNTQYLEEGINLDMEKSQYLSLSGNDDFRFYVGNVTVFSHKTNLYSGFKSNDLVVLGRSTAISKSFTPVNTVDFFKGGDVFVSNEFDIRVHTVKLHEFSSRDALWRYATDIKIKGVFGAVNSSRLFNDKSADSDPKTIGDKDEPDRIDPVFLNSLDYTFEVKHEEDLSTINDINTILTANLLSDTFITEFPYRIHRGVKIPKESISSYALRTFLTEDYYECANDKGELIAVRGSDRAIYIQYRFALFASVIKDKLKTDGADTYLGTPNLFDRDPEEIEPDEKGHIGSISKISCKIIRGNYITINAAVGQIFIVTGLKANLISANKNRNWFYENWDIGLDFYKIDERTGEKRRLDNPYISMGYCIGYDEKYNRLLFTKKSYKFIRQDLEGPALNFDGEFYYLNGKRLDFDSAYFENTSVTLSYSLDYNAWICPHDYFPRFYFYTNSKLYAANGGTLTNDPNSNVVTNVFETNDLDTVGKYFGKRFESYVDIVFNNDTSITKNLLALSFITSCGTKNAYLQHKPISKVLIYSDTQCSDIIEVDSDNVFRTIKGEYRLNDFRDTVINPDAVIIDEKGRLNTSNIDSNKLWFERKNFSGKFIVVRLIMDNLDDNSFHIHEVNTISSISNRK